MATRKIVVRNSPIHGRGVYAARDIAKGEKIIQYRGERISWAEADRRPSSDPKDPNHTFLFSLSSGKHVIDASVGGNAARWINHSCTPNCETEETDDERVFVEAIRDIRAGEELFYDYGLIIDERITPKVKAQYRCLCGARSCRGTMLAIKTRRPAAKQAAKKTAKKIEKTAQKTAQKTAKPAGRKVAKQPAKPAARKAAQANPAKPSRKTAGRAAR